MAWLSGPAKTDSAVVTLVADKLAFEARTCLVVGLHDVDQLYAEHKDVGLYRGTPTECLCRSNLRLVQGS